MHFHEDVQEPPMELFHKLKLYADADPTNQGTKKPVRTAVITNTSVGKDWCRIRLLCRPRLKLLLQLKASALGGHLP